MMKQILDLSKLEPFYTTYMHALYIPPPYNAVVRLTPSTAAGVTITMQYTSPV